VSSDDDREPGERAALERLAARGVLATGVAGELAGPIEAVYAKLAATVERLDRHVATARGPEPLPWIAVGDLRERVADAFLAVGRARQLAGSLATLADTARRQSVDLNEIVERALTLARHRFFGSAERDVLVDLATLPPIEVDAGSLTLAIAFLLVNAAEAQNVAQVVVRTGSTPSAVFVRVEVQRDSQSSSPSAVAADPELLFADVIRACIEGEGGSLETTSDPASLVLELALPRPPSVR